MSTTWRPQWNTASYTEYGNWQIYDIVIEGVSLVNNYRTQFNSVILKDSYASLVKQMHLKREQEQAGSPEKGLECTLYRLDGSVRRAARGAGPGPDDRLSRLLSIHAGGGNRCNTRRQTWRCALTTR